jgi:hypothetical protein
MISIDNLKHVQMWLEDTADLDDIGDAFAYMVLSQLIEEAMKAPNPCRVLLSTDEYTKSNEEVDVIASGYEWECPVCGQFHTEIEMKEPLVCHECKNKFHNTTTHEAWE